MATEIAGLAGLKELVGTHLGYSEWLEITQERVNTFADATCDWQWIHTEPERAKKESPFGMHDTRHDTHHTHDTPSL